MDSSRRVTSIFIAVALLALAALAFSVNQQDARKIGIDMSALPGLAENLQSIENITRFPHENFRSVKIMRTNGDEISLVRLNTRSGFEFSGEPPSETDKTAFSAILYANSAFLNELSSADSFAVTGGTPEQQIGRLVYMSFDGLVLENTVFRAGNATWLKIKADFSDNLAAETPETARQSLLSASEVKDFVSRLQGRMYKKPDEPRQ